MTDPVLAEAVVVGGQRRFALPGDDGPLVGGRLPWSWDDALRLTADELAARISEPGEVETVAAATTSPPLGQLQEVWASGVTYARSRDARTHESEVADVYDLVYDAERPELFLKAPAWRVVGSGQRIGVRADSTWDVPEPELALVVNANGEVVGWTIGDDVSSRSIEGANPLYLPQAKIYDRSCALGPRVVLGRPSTDLVIELVVVREGDVVVTGQVGFDQLRRPPDELVEHLRRSLTLPHGAVLLTGAGLVPDDDFTLTVGDRVEITIQPAGTLVNTVVEV